MTDFGVRKICARYDIVLLDASALLTTEDEGPFDFTKNRGKLFEQLKLEDRRRHAAYISALESLAGRSLFIAGCQRKEFSDYTKVLGRRKERRAREAGRYHRLLAFCGAVLKKAVLEYDESEKTAFDELSDYFSPLRRGRNLSDTDFGIMVSSVVFANRGPVGVLTNDSGMLNAYDDLLRYLPAGYRKRFGRLPNRLSVYSSLGGEFEKNSEYDPEGKILVVKKAIKGEWKNRPFSSLERL